MFFNTQQIKILILPWCWVMLLMDNTFLPVIFHFSSKLAFAFKQSVCFIADINTFSKSRATSRFTWTVAGGSTPSVTTFELFPVLITLTRFFVL